MPEAGGAELIVTDWQRHGRELAAVRRAVFVEEQGIAESDEWDAADALAQHVLVTLNREPVGTGRLLATGKIGRLAVLKRLRGRGIGSLLLKRLVALGRDRGLDGVYLHAQATALHFYAAHGFTAEGPEFDEAGIRHRRMRLAFSAEQRPDPEADGGPHAARER